MSHPYKFFLDSFSNFISLSWDVICFRRFITKSSNPSLSRLWLYLVPLYISKRDGSYLAMIHHDHPFTFYKHNTLINLLHIPFPEANLPLYIGEKRTTSFLLSLVCSQLFSSCPLQIAWKQNLSLPLAEQALLLEALSSEVTYGF